MHSWCISHQRLPMIDFLPLRYLQTEAGKRRPRNGMLDGHKGRQKRKRDKKKEGRRRSDGVRRKRGSTQNGHRGGNSDTHAAKTTRGERSDEEAQRYKTTAVFSKSDENRAKSRRKSPSMLKYCRKHTRPASIGGALNTPSVQRGELLFARHYLCILRALRAS